MKRQWDIEELIEHFTLIEEDDEQALAALSLHLLQICLVYVNTLLIQQVLTDPKHLQQMKKEDLRALTPLIYSHVTPYGTFRLDLSERIPIEEAISA